jgi:4'-phosphopantetheinyl transferase EntD
MLSPHKQVPPAQALLSVATLASDALVEKEFMGCLTLAERDRLLGIRNATRRKKWLAGRMAAKYLYLERQNPLRPRRAPAEMEFTELARDNIASFAPSSYREVEILPVGGSTGNVPRLSARDAEQNYPDISLSHTDGLSCACLAYGATVGVDLELPVRRLDSFYRVNFTRAESEWVRVISGRNDINPFWLYTVLWSLKESALKFRHCGESSVWDIPNIEINMLSDTTDWARLYNRTALGEGFVFVPIEINERCGTRHAQAALTATRHLILVISK